MSNQEAPLVKLNKTKTRRWNWNSCLTIVGIFIALIFIAPPVARFGYCHGWWLCDCGPEFEQSLYPDNIEIIVSACSDPKEATLSLDGRYMIVGVRSAGKSILLDFVMDQKRAWLYSFPSLTDVEFWTDKLVQVRDVNQKKL